MSRIDASSVMLDNPDVIRRIVSDAETAVNLSGRRSMVEKFAESFGIWRMIHL